MEKVASVTIRVPHKSAGNVVRQKEVDFEVFHGSGHYRIKPLLTEEERRLANLPESLDFYLQDKKAISSRGPKDGNLHVIQDVLVRLQEQNILS